jgi:fluoride ion exporter CrcB/FEX
MPTVYVRAVYTISAQFYDGRDWGRYFAPIIMVTSCGALLGFLSASSVVDAHTDMRITLGLLSGFMGGLATILTALRSAQKFDVKAEMFRLAAGR